MCDVYLNLFRGIAVLDGIDFGPIAAFFVLNLLTSSVASLGAPMAAAEPPASATPQQRREHARRVAFAPRCARAASASASPPRAAAWR